MQDYSECYCYQHDIYRLWPWVRKTTFASLKKVCTLSLISSFSLIFDSSVARFIFSQLCHILNPTWCFRQLYTKLSNLDPNTSFNSHCSWIYTYCISTNDSRYFLSDICNPSDVWSQNKQLRIRHMIRLGSPSWDGTKVERELLLTGRLHVPGILVFSFPDRESTKNSLHKLLLKRIICLIWILQFF